MYMIQNVAFGYYGDCKICDLVSVTSGVLKSHLADVHWGVAGVGKF